MGKINRFGFVLLVLSVSMEEQLEGKAYEKPLNCGHRSFKASQSSRLEVMQRLRGWLLPQSPLPPTKTPLPKGNNDKPVKINMTAPVLVNIHPASGPLRNISFIVHFYMPQKYRRNPPQSAEAHPVKLLQHKFAAVRRFGGFMDDSNISAQMSALKKSLKGTAWESSILNKLGGDSLLYTAAGYNSHFEYENRVNEVIIWFD